MKQRDDQQLPTSASSALNPPVFLGVSRSVLIRDQGLSHDFFGVTHTLLCPFFPQKLANTFLLVAINANDSSSDLPFKLTVENSVTNASSWVEMKITRSTECLQIQLGHVERVPGYNDRPRTDPNSQGTPQSRICMKTPANWKLYPIPCPPLMITQPTTVRVRIAANNQEFDLGVFDLEFHQPRPLTPEECRAILSRPGSPRSIEFTAQCNGCHAKSSYVVALSRDETTCVRTSDPDHLVDSQDHWRCRCGGLNFPLKYLRLGLHDLFRYPAIRGTETDLTLVPNYEAGALAATRCEYLKLLEEAEDDESKIQRFMEENEVIWNFLAPSRIFHKPRILGKYVADFGVLNLSRILYLIEIEKPSTKLQKKKGGVSAELQQGRDQLSNWKREIENERGAVLDGMGLSSADVDDIRLVLVAGMSTKMERGGIEAVRRDSSVENHFFCFDDLGAFLLSTEASLKKI